MNDVDSYELFLEKYIQVILTLPNGKVLFYKGILKKDNINSLILNDKKMGIVLLAKKDVSQITILR